MTIVMREIQLRLAAKAWLEQASRRLAENRLSGEPVTFRSFVLRHYPTSQIASPNKAVILSEALRTSIAQRRVCGAESKDPGDAYGQMLLGAFRPRTAKGR